MHDFQYRRGELFCEEVPVWEIAARVGTPCYVYSRRTILEHVRKLREAFPGALLCYSVKANSNLSILALMRAAGTGFDIVSGGELYRVLRVGAAPERVVFAGVGKRDEEIRLALRHRIGLFNVESEQEAEVLRDLARREGVRADAALRINPDVDAVTHRHITTGKLENKFGVDLRTAREVLRRAKGWSELRIRGVHVHIGSQITSVDPFVETVRRVGEFLREARGLGHPMDTLDLGGGFGIWYEDRRAPTADRLGAAIRPWVEKTGCRLLLEPGRFIVGNAGILLTRVLFTKSLGGRRIAICDAGMNDLIRPALYGAYHRIRPVLVEGQVSGEVPEGGVEGIPTDVVGPICETGDTFARERRLPRVGRGDVLAVFSAGAYGYVMASNYNSHPRPAEVLVGGERFEVVTERESYGDLVRRERIPPWVFPEGSRRDPSS